MRESYLNSLRKGAVKEALDRWRGRERERGREDDDEEVAYLRLCCLTKGGVASDMVRARTSTRPQDDDIKDLTLTSPTAAHVDLDTKCCVRLRLCHRTTISCIRQTPSARCLSPAVWDNPATGGPQYNNTDIACNLFYLGQ
jgi:hypothetical protein